MNYLKKKLKPLTTGFTNPASNATAAGSSSSGHHHHHQQHNRHNNNRHNFDKDLEDDLYDEYVVEAPPHPSELLALGVDPTDIDVNNPEKLKELYRKAKEEGKDKKTNSVLLARQRQKEEIEEKKKTREEWKFFDSITARVEQAVKDSQKTLEQLKESSAIDKLAEPEYELKLSADQVFKSSHSVKQEKSADNWIDFNEDDSNKKTGKQGEKKPKEDKPLLDEFGCSIERRRSSAQVPSGFGGTPADTSNFVVEELLNDFGIDLRSAEQKKLVKEDKAAINKQANEQESVSNNNNNNNNSNNNNNNKPLGEPRKLDINLKAAARPRPRPVSAKVDQVTVTPEEDPFDTSFVASEPALLEEQHDEKQLFSEDDLLNQPISNQGSAAEESGRVVDPFDTSYVNL